MIVQKGTLVKVVHSQRGAFTARVAETFNTEREVFFPPILEDDVLYGHGYDWHKGDCISCNRQFLRAFEILEGKRAGGKHYV